MNWGHFSRGHQGFERKSGEVAAEERSFAAWKEKLLWFGISGVGLIGGWMIRNQLAMFARLDEIQLAQAVLTERLANQASIVQEVKQQNEGTIRAQAVIQGEIYKVNAKLGID